MEYVFKVKKEIKLKAANVFLLRVKMVERPETQNEKVFPAQADVYLHKKSFADSFKSSFLVHIPLTFKLFIFMQDKNIMHLR